MKTKEYRLKVDLPGGLKKGSIVTLSTGITSADKNWIWKGTETSCPWNPTKEPTFFEECLYPKFADGVDVILKPEIAKRHNISPKIEFHILRSEPRRNGSKNTFIYYCTCAGREAGKFLEEDLCLPSYYYFVNSKGIVCREISTPEHLKTETFNWRNATGNVHLTNEAAHIWKNSFLK